MNKYSFISLAIINLYIYGQIYRIQVNIVKSKHNAWQ